MPMSNYLEGKLLRHVFNNEVYTPPGTVYLALFLESPNADGTGGTEVSGAGYERIPLDFNVTEGAPSAANLAEPVEFPTASEGWGTVTVGALFDAQTGGNLLSYKEFTDPASPSDPLPKDVTTGDVLRVTSGNLRITMGS